MNKLEDGIQNEKADSNEPVLIYTEDFLNMSKDAQLLFLNLYIKCRNGGLVLAPQATARAIKVDERNIEYLIKHQYLIQSGYEEYYIPNIFKPHVLLNGDKDPFGWEDN